MRRQEADDPGRVVLAGVEDDVSYGERASRKKDHRDPEGRAEQEWSAASREESSDALHVSHFLSGCFFRR
jgi:hypothetical protein